MRRFRHQFIFSPIAPTMVTDTISYHDFSALIADVAQNADRFMILPDERCTST